MNKSFVGSCIVILTVIGLVAYNTGSLLLFSVSPVLITMVLCGVLVLLISNTHKNFARAFVIGSGKWKDIQLVKIQSSYEAVHFLIKFELYFGVFLSVISFIVLIFNWDNKNFAGPNLYTFLTSLFNAFLIALILYPLETSLKLRMFSYMDDSELNNDFQSEVKYSIFNSWIKIISNFAYLVLFISFIVIFLFTTMKNDKDICIPFDFFSILYLFIFLLSALFWSKSLRYFRLNVFFNVSKLYLKRYSNYVCESIDLACKTLLTSSGIMSVLGFIGILRNLEDASSLVPNVYFSLFPILYSSVICIFFIIVKTNVKK